MAQDDIRDIALPDLLTTTLEAMGRLEPSDLDSASSIIPRFEEIALRGQIDRQDFMRVIDSPKSRLQLHILIAQGAAAIGDVLAHSIQAEEKDDNALRAKANEIGSRLQHVTAMLAGLASRRTEG
jgi:hypothetical protein